jgi:hypothetical protein
MKVGPAGIECLAAYDPFVVLCLVTWMLANAIIIFSFYKQCGY